VEKRARLSAADTEEEEEGEEVEVVSGDNAVEEG
jgi:hypothetical protein